MIVNNVIAGTINDNIQEAWNKVVREIGGRIISKLDYVLTLQIDEGAENGINEDSATVTSERNALLLKNSYRICFCVDEKRNRNTIRYTAIEEAIKYWNINIVLNKQP